MTNLQWFVLVTLAISLLTMVRDQTVRFWPKTWKEDPQHNVPNWFKRILEGFGCISSLFGLTILPFVFILTFSPVWQWWTGTVAFTLKAALSIWIHRMGGDEKTTKVVRYTANILTFVMWAYLLWYLIK